VHRRGIKSGYVGAVIHIGFFHVVGSLARESYAARPASVVRGAAAGIAATRIMVIKVVSIVRTLAVGLISSQRIIGLPAFCVFDHGIDAGDAKVASFFDRVHAFVSLTLTLERAKIHGLLAGRSFLFEGAGAERTSVIAVLNGIVFFPRR